MRALLIGLGLLLAGEAAACGVCLEDKVASCYDHGVVTRAIERGQKVAFFALQGPLVRSPETQGAVLRAIQSARGAQKGSARVSLENAAISFAFDPARTNVARAQEEIARKLATQHLDLGLLTVLDGNPQYPASAGLK